MGLGAALLGLGMARRNRPLHTVGDQWHGRLHVYRRGKMRTPTGRTCTGSRLLDRPGRYAALVRRSRAVSWPLPWDIPGLAVRVPGAPRGPVDLLLAGTGGSMLGRFVLRLRRGDDGPLTTLLPLRSARGPVWFRADPAGRRTWRLSVAVGRGDWQRWATLRAGRRHRGELRFDPVNRPPDGLVWPRWMRVVRDPAYRWSQRWT